MGTVTTAPHAANAAATLSALYDSGPSQSPGVPPACPERVGRYQIGDRLGAGAMGVVYRAHDPDLGRDVAIKLVRHTASPSNLRLLREAQAMARLHHPNVVPIFDVGQAGDAVFVAMPLIEGGTLKRWLRGGARPVDDVLDRFLAAGRGLAAAHAAGLVHRDFKPDNVLLGAGGEICVADFGLARLSLSIDEPVPEASADCLTADQLTQTGVVLGTPAYMAPEQLRGRTIDARADQFSFCVALWEAVYGQRPFAEPSGDAGRQWAARLDAIAAGPIPPRRDRPAWLAPLLARGLAGDPDRRWPTLRVLLDAIAARRRHRRWPRWLATAVLLGLVAAGALTRPAPDVLTPAPSPPDAPAAARLTPLARYDDLKAAAVSPDGTKLAFVAGDSLVLQALGIEAMDRTVVDHGIEPPISWSPDGRHLLVGATSEHASLRRVELVDADSGARRPLVGADTAAFLSTDEIAVASYRQRAVTILQLADPIRSVASCTVPGDYTFLWRVAGLPDGTLVAETLTLDTGRHRLVILHPGCAVRATFAQEPLASFALSDTGTVIALSERDASSELLEISLDGAIVSRRRVSDAIDDVIGRRRGIDYVTTLAPRTALTRLRGGAAQPVWSIDSNAALYVAPDGEAVAWIARDGRAPRPRPLWLSSLPRTSGARVLVDRALTAAWSPDGRRLAVLADDELAAAPGAMRSASRPVRLLLVTDRSGAVISRQPVDDVDPEAAPVWLDDHRIAVRTGDRLTYRGIDLVTGDQGEILDRRRGSTLWLTRSPRDGTLAMFRMGSPTAAAAGAGPLEHLWIQPPGGEPRPVHVDDVKHFLAPSWTASGELVVRALETGEVSRVALDTGELTPLAQLAPTPLSLMYDDHLVMPRGGDLLAIRRELGANVAKVRLDDTAPAAAGGSL
ncbi:MAG TPA: protein kinase [Kofleriaceae bacterium]|nr:protein kinase [Kofleriaceae bacterium]